MNKRGTEGSYDDVKDFGIAQEEQSCQNLDCISSQESGSHVVPAAEEYDQGSQEQDVSGEDKL